MIRFDRFPTADDRDRAAGWLRDGLAELRRRGYRTLIAAGQSRGAWNSLQILDTPGLADAVIAVSPAAHGFGASTNLAAQSDDFRRIMAQAAPQHARVAFVQFADDFYIGDADTRRRLLDGVLKPKIDALVVIDRPPGFAGHGAGNSQAFARRFGPCLYQFATATIAPTSC